MLTKSFYYWVACIGILCINIPVKSQDSTHVNNIALAAVGGTGIAAYGITMVGLSTIWYQNQNQVGFHFSNDNASWLQVDKMGHAFSSYAFGKIGMEALKMTGLEHKKAVWFGGTYGFLFLTTVEVIDGHYSAWGFSTGDMIANAAGPALLIGQELLLNKQYVSFKYSFHPTEFQDLRPAVFGGNIFSQTVSDYNGQTYWVSTSLGSIAKNKKYLPPWLCFSFGYGAYGMLSGYSNPNFDNYGNPYPEFERTRHFYFSLDLDLTKIKTKSKALRTIFSALNLVKIPFPTIELSSNGKFNFHPIYF